MFRICILFNRFGPYHLARLRSASTVCDLVAIEIFPKDPTYAWKPADSAIQFTRAIVFPHESRDSLRGADVLRGVTRALEDLRPDVVAVNGWSDRASLGALSWCTGAGVPAIVMSESQVVDEPRNALNESIKRRVVRLCSAGFVGGRPHADYLHSLGMDGKRIFTGYDVVDNPYFLVGSQVARGNADQMRRDGCLPERYFLASNRFIEKKNIPRLLQAYSTYRKSAGPDAWKLVLLGDGPLKNEILRLRGELSVDKDLILPGFKQYGELPLYYGLAGAFVHASTSEQWGLVVNEAMASGLPVLVSNRCGCAPDLVQEGRNGFSFDPYDVDALAQHMLDFSSGKYDLGAMGQASREIISHWTPEVFAENLWRAADAALNAPRRKAGLIDKTLLWGLIRR